MIDRAERTGFGVAVVGHAALLVALTVGLATAGRIPPPSDAIEVSFVDEIGLVSASPQPVESPPEQGMAPETGPTEDAQAQVREPAPPMPVARPEPKPAAAAPAPRQPRSTPREAQQATRERSRRSLIGPDLLKGIGRDPSPSRSRQAPAAMDAQAAAGIADAIRRQVQPCADRQVYPGPGAERIVVTMNLKLNRDGSLAAPPRVIRRSGVDDQNSRYAERVEDIAIATFTGCSPLRGLPGELYDVPRGWSNFFMTYRLPGWGH